MSYSANIRQFIAALTPKLHELTCLHEHLLRGRLSSLKKYANKDKDDRTVEAMLNISSWYEEYLQYAKNRLAHQPKLIYQEDLPVFLKKEEIIKAITTHQVVIVAGETGSGKTTQLPKMCLEAGFGRRGLIGHTQPRRLAARAVAFRIAKELNEPLGSNIGYKVRFNDVSKDDGYIRLMTDGILLSETMSDRLLLKYDCIIIDEAHERSLNIDFLLGYLKQILKKRPELRLIITSATINTRRFAEHFDNAPIIEVSGRTYPVEQVYLPNLEHSAEEEDDTEDCEKDLRYGILKGLDYLFTNYGRADTLVFLPGEREIMDVARFLSKARLYNVEILPLYARLAISDQNKIFAPHDKVRIVLATNVAETSVTVPFIKYVIDPGTARISRYSPHTKVQRLHIEKISRASAAQRAGRCGRTSAGVCVRLYSKEDFLNRDEYTDPEILRTNLSSVILSMVSLNLGDIRDFPFIDAPTPRQISDGIRELYELKALDYTVKKAPNLKGETVKTIAQESAKEQFKLTTIGKALSKLPVDPRLGRMLVEASRVGALREILIIVSVLSIVDPRERPLDKREQSEKMHARFNMEKSDFLSLVRLFEYLVKTQEELSTNAFKKRLKSEFISYLRVREWFDLLRQLKVSVSLLGYSINEVEASYEAVHRAILSGLLSQIGVFDSEEKNLYLGARGLRFSIHPASALVKHKPKWLCAWELSETTKLYAKTVAVIDPLWLESQADHLIKRHYAEPFFSKDKGAVLANLSITLYGLKIVEGRKVLYSNVDRELCRTLFIRDGLIPGNVSLHEDFLRHNLSLVRDVEEVEEKIRRRDLLVDDSVMLEFYLKRIPDDIVTVRHFVRWWQDKKKEDPHYLDFTLEEVARDGFDKKLADDFPPFFETLDGNFKLPLTYVFDPKSEDDGVTVTLPLPVLSSLNPHEFAYLVKGLRLELLTALIKSLPKRLRKALIPAPNFASALYESLTMPNSSDLYTECARELSRMGGQQVTPSDFDLGQIDKHLFMNFKVIDKDGKVLKKGRNLKAISEALSENIKKAFKSLHVSSKKMPVSDSWTFGRIDEFIDKKQQGLVIKTYPALSVQDKGVTLALYESPLRQKKAMREGLVRLLTLGIKDPVSYLEKHLNNRAKLAMYYQPLGTVRELLDDLVECTVGLLLDEYSDHNVMLCNDKSKFEKALFFVKGRLNEKALELAVLVEKILVRSHALKKELKSRVNLSVAISYKDAAFELDNLVYKGFLSRTPYRALVEIPRYLDALELRLEKVHRDVNRDLVYQRKVEEVIKEYRNTLSRYPKDAVPEELCNIKWMIEELRVSYFAQSIGAKIAVSDKRISHELKRILEEYREHN